MSLLQRDKGRDLLDLAYATVEFEGLDCVKLVECFSKYLKAADQSISRAEAEQRMFAKLAKPRFLSDMRPLLPVAQSDLWTAFPARRRAYGVGGFGLRA